MTTQARERPTATSLWHATAKAAQELEDITGQSEDTLAALSAEIIAKEREVEEARAGVDKGEEGAEAMLEQVLEEVDKLRVVYDELEESVAETQLPDGR
ncbi:MAG TPA: hypothetical protein VFH61_16280 [Thermoleophilia bacterium]|nr:hypothetical protein [Thermoleophilia bacterium]